MHWSRNHCLLVHLTEPLHIFSSVPSGSNSVDVFVCATVTVVVSTPLKRLTVLVSAFARETGALGSAFNVEARIAMRAKEESCMVVGSREQCPEINIGN